MRCTLLLAFVAAVFGTGSMVLADSRWLDDTLVSPAASSTDRVVLDVKEDDSVWFALVSGNQVGEGASWHKSTDAGASWTQIYSMNWVIADAAIGGAYGFDVVLQVWQAYGNLWYRVLDSSTGGTVSSGVFAYEGTRKARKIVVDSDAEVGPDQVFIACAHLVDTETGQATLKAYRTTDLGLTWTHFSILDQGPAGEPDYFGDMDLGFAINGYPYFHVVYRRSGRIWHVRTTDAGQTWEAPTELIVNVSETTQVSVAFLGILGIAVGESPGGQVVYCHSNDAGASWSNAMLIDEEEALPRLPSACANFGPWTVVYRKDNGRLAVRTNGTPHIPTNWTSEAYATLGTTDLPISTCMSGYPDGNTGVLYVRLEDSGRPYFASAHGEPSAVGKNPTVAAAGSLVAYPTPSSGSVTVLLNEWSDSSPAAWTSGWVMDPAGRIVAQLGRTDRASTHLVRWDGKNAGGRHVANGKYYVYLATPAGVRSAPVVILR